MNSFLFLAALTAATAAALIALGKRDAATRGAGLRNLDVRGFALAGAMTAAGLALLVDDSVERTVQATGTNGADWVFTGDLGPDPESWTPPGETEDWKPFNGIPQD